MMEALQEEKVIGKLKELGHEPDVYVYGMLQPSLAIGAAALFGVFAMVGNQPKPFILGFAKKGIALLELNMTCSKYTGLHAFITAENIEEISFKKGLLVYTLTLRTKDSNKQMFKISKIVAGVSWQKANVEKLDGFIKTIGV
ncbi:MAG: hypothetical protein LBU19_02075 [Treponema sp.]|jgi:hypothetical protein|nr:hypothetical protein [Treponema sp.]